jgi:hypothetical protein
MYREESQKNVKWDWRSFIEDRRNYARDSRKDTKDYEIYYVPVGFSCSLLEAGAARLFLVRCSLGKARRRARVSSEIPGRRGVIPLPFLPALIFL